MSELLRKKTLIAGKDPMGLAPSILYIASKETDETKTTVKMKRPSQPHLGFGTASSKRSFEEHLSSCEM